MGSLFTIIAIVTWALASLVYKFGVGKTDAKANLLFRLIMVSTATLIFSLIFGNYDHISMLNNIQLFDYLIACLISGACVTAGDLAYFTSLEKIDASRAYPLIQLSLVFVYPLAFIFFGEEITISVFLGGILILSSVFILSIKDKDEKGSSEDIKQSESLLKSEKGSVNEQHSEQIFIGVVLASCTAFLWAIAIVSFNQARIISNDVLFTNFFRVLFATIIVAILGIFKRGYYSSFKKEERKNLKYYFIFGMAGSLSLGLADAFYYKAAEINGLILTSTFTANTPMVQQIFSIIFLKEKFRKRFIIAVFLIILGNYIILFL